jgi:hypothetical protein
VTQRFAHGVGRAGPYVAEHHADGAMRQRPEPRNARRERMYLPTFGRRRLPQPSHSSKDAKVGPEAVPRRRGGRDQVQCRHVSDPVRRPGACVLGRRRAWGRPTKNVRVASAPDVLRPVGCGARWRSGQDPTASQRTLGLRNGFGVSAPVLCADPSGAINSLPSLLARRAGGRRGAAEVGLTRRRRFANGRRREPNSAQRPRASASAEGVRTRPVGSGKPSSGLRS